MRGVFSSSLKCSSVSLYFCLRILTFYTSFLMPRMLFIFMLFALVF